MMSMSSCNLIYSFIFTIFSYSLVLPFVMSHPLAVSESPYGKFIDFLLKNNCTMPKEVKLPFSKSSDPSPFSYLSTPLSECQTSDALNENSESNMLCREVFDVIQNITCSENIEPILKIASCNLSSSVCSDFKIMKDVFPKRSDYLSGKLTDEIICKVLCTSNKYELLCKTLLWSYDTLIKIQNSLEKEVQDNAKERTNKASSVKVLSSIKVSLGENEPKSNNQNDDIPSNPSAGDKNSENEIVPDGSHLNYSSLTVPDTKAPNGLGGTTVSTSTKFSVLTHKIQDKAVNNSVTTSKLTVTTSQKNVSETENKELLQKVTNKAANPIVTDTVSLSNQNRIDEHENIDHKENEINNEPVKAVKVLDNNSQENDNTDDLKDNTDGIKKDQKVQNFSEEILQSKEKDKTNTENDKKTGIKSEESGVLYTETSNGLNNVNPQENESKNKNTNFKTQDEKELEKPKLTNFENPNEVLPDVDSKLPESSTLQILPDEDAEEHQEDKEQDQYNDTENEGDYQKADYDNFNLPTKNRETNIKSSISDSNQISNNYDGFISPRNNIGRGPEEVPMIPFPEQEDSHFFFYFLTVVLIFMAGYLIFHNKQKIIALIVEGRHERRRRSHGAGYKKLETK